jgi:hypothetical protein
LRWLIRRLKKVDLPTFGRPTIATIGFMFLLLYPGYQSEFLACGSMVLLIMVLFIFALCKRKNE